MDFELTDDQQLLQDTTRRFIDATSPISKVRALATDPIGCEPTWWREAAQLGWTSLLISEEHGGGSLAGQGLLDLVVIAEELGAHMQPGPFLPTNVVAAAIRDSGSPAQRSAILPALASGESIATWCFAEVEDRWQAEAIHMTARSGEDRFLLNGTKHFVQDAHWATDLLVSARTAQGLTQFLVSPKAPGVEIRAMQTLDLARRMFVVQFDNVSVTSDSLVGELGGAERAIEYQLQIALVLLCAETVGCIDSVFSATLRYAKDRVAFGRPIGSYQAIKHRLADMYCAIEAAKGAATAAARAVQDGSPEAPLLVSVAKTYLGLVGRTSVSDCQQILGGIGMTWEHNLHLFLRRVTTNAALYGSTGEHRQRICELVESVPAE